MSLLLQDTLVISPATVQRIDAEIEEIKNNTDVADVVADKAELDAYDTSKLTDNAIIKVLQDESENDASTYYRYIKSSDTFELIGSVGPYYTKAESDNIETQIRQDFTDADTTLQNNITAEETRATGVENQLRTDLTTETTRATGKEAELNTAITTHTSNTSNPHNVTKAQVGLGNVDNTSDLNKPISTATQTALDGKVDKLASANRVYITNSSSQQSAIEWSNGNAASTVAVRDSNSQLGVALTPTANTHATSKQYVDNALNLKLDKTEASSTYATITNLNSHTSNTSNPHSVTKAQVGLGNVDNTSDANKPISTATQTALNSKLNKVTISTTTGTVALADNTIFNGDELSTLTVTNPSNPTVDFLAQVNFTSGATATTVTPNQDIVYVGDNVNENVGFVPRANCRYTVMFIYDGSNIRGIVQGVSL